MASHEANEEIMKKYYYLYLVTNQVNDKIYYGVHSTNNIDDGYMGSGTALKRAQLKYGIESFSKTIVEFFDNKDDMLHAESLIVDKEFVARDDTYNLIPGGGYISYSRLPSDQYRIGQLNYQATITDEERSRRMAVMGRKSHWSSDRLNNWKKSLSKANTNNPNVISANKSIHANMSESTKKQRIDKIRKAKVELYSDMCYDEKVKRLSAATEASKRRIICEHCGKESNTGNYARWHGENCKERKL